MKRFRLIEEPSTQFDRVKQKAEYDQDKVSYLVYIGIVVRTSRQTQYGPQGVTLDEMEKGLRILALLKDKKIGDILELEDADWEYLCEKVKDTKWMVTDERIYRFCKTILNATQSVLDEEGPQNTNASTNTNKRATIPRAAKRR